MEDRTRRMFVVADSFVQAVIATIIESPWPRESEDSTYIIYITLVGGVRTNVHDNLQALWVVMLKAAGFQSVRLEDRSWDAEAPRSDKNRRRPDIV